MNNKYLSLAIDSENYLIPLSFVTTIYQISSRREFSHGFNEGGVSPMSFRGKNLPVFDLMNLLSRSSKNNKNSRAENCVIDLKLSFGDFGAFVENLDGIITFKSSDVQVFKDPLRPMICGKAYGVRRTYMVLDPEQLIDKITIKKLTDQPVHYSKAG